MKKIIAKTAMYEITEEPRAKFEPFITDPVKYAEAQADNLLNYYCKLGLLKPVPKDRRPQPGKLYETFRHRVYAVLRFPLKDDERFILDQFHELDHEIGSFAARYRTGRHEEAAFRAFRIGSLCECLAVLQYDRDVATGRPLRKGRPKGSAATKKKWAARRAELTAKYQPDINRRVREGQSFEQALIYTANQHHIPRETLRNYVVNPRRTRQPKV